MRYCLVLILAVLLTAYACPGQDRPAGKDVTVVFGHWTWGSGTYYKISPDGTVTSYSFSNMPRTVLTRDQLFIRGNRRHAPKTPRFRKRISSKDLDEIRSTIKAAGLIDLPVDLIGKAQGCPNDMTLSDTSGDQITIVSNGVIKRLSSFCTGSPGTAADLYAQLYKHLNDLMKNVKIKGVSKEEFYKSLN